MENGLFEGIESLQAQVTNHRKLLREVDTSLKRLSGNANGNESKNIRRDNTNNPRHGNMNSIGGFNSDNKMNPLHRTMPPQQQYVDRGGSGGQRDMMRGLVRKASLGNENDRMMPHQHDRHMDQYNDSRSGPKRKSYDGQYQSGAKRVVNSAINYASQPDPDSGDEDNQRVSYLISILYYVC